MTFNKILKARYVFLVIIFYGMPLLGAVCVAEGGISDFIKDFPPNYFVEYAPEFVSSFVAVLAIVLSSYLSWKS